MKYTDTDTLVVLDDQSFSKKFKSFRNIESVLPRIDNYVPIKGDIFIKDRKTKISLEPDNPSWNLDWDWEVNDEGPPKDKEEIFHDFFGELFFAPNELILTDYMPPNQKDYWDYFVFTKKKFLEQKKNYVFNNIKNLYFYKIAHDFLRPKEEKFTLPKSINTEEVELLYISHGQIVDFDTITPSKFPNLKKLILDTKIKSNKIPNFKKLEELFYHNHEKNITIENLDNLKHLMVGQAKLSDVELKKIYKIFGGKLKIYKENIKKVLKKRKISI
tara:strand:+ start:45 stop:863 length:819 start_codon:yes stop_codon:yes gene_type:complete